jgi:hypothetical protein
VDRVKGDSVAMHIPAPLSNNAIYATADGAAQYLEFAICPDCSMIATAQGDGCLGSTDGPVDHVRVTCVQRHWFLMPANMLSERLRLH